MPYSLGMTKLASLPLRPARISPKLREAIRLHVTEGKPIGAACEVAGMSRAGYHKAMKRAAVRDLVEDVQRRFVLEVEARRGVYKARAFEVALDLMMNAKSEAVRARMAEFLASEGRMGQQVNVHVDARTVGGGYEFVRPGARMVEIEPGQVDVEGGA